MCLGVRRGGGVGGGTLSGRARTVLRQASDLLIDFLGAFGSGPGTQGRVNVLLAHQLVDEVVVDGLLGQALHRGPAGQHRVQGRGQQGLCGRGACAQRRQVVVPRTASCKM
jgi:hypothetical protein